MGCTQSTAAVTSPNIHSTAPTTTTANNLHFDTTGGNSTNRSNNPPSVTGAASAGGGDSTPVKGTNGSNNNRSFQTAHATTTTIAASTRPGQRQQDVSSGAVSIPSSPVRKRRGSSTSDSLQQNGILPTTLSSSPKKPSTTTSSSTTTGLPSSSLSATTSAVNLHYWNTLWQTLPHPIDPSDVPSVISELMANQTNRLLATDILLLQRQIRAITSTGSGGTGSGSTSSGGGAVKNGKKIMTGRIRSALTASSVGGGSSSGTGGTHYNNDDSRSAEKRRHVLEEGVLRKLWRHNVATTTATAGSEFATIYHITPTTSRPPLDILGSAIVLIRHLGEGYLWEKTFAIAVQVAQESGLEMDVNKQVKQQQQQQKVADAATAGSNNTSNSTAAIRKLAPPLPPLQQVVWTTDEGGGGSSSSSSATTNNSLDITFHSVCFLMSLALRGTRIQRLQLLFYLLIPPTELQRFIESHPAGGIPTWLLEVDNNTVLSLTSMAHYYYYGDTFSPLSSSSSQRHSRHAGTTSSTAGATTTAATALQLSPLQVMETVANILTLSSKPQINGGNGGGTGSGSHHHHHHQYLPSSPERRSKSTSAASVALSISSSRHRRSDASESSVSEHNAPSSSSFSPVLEYVQQFQSQILGCGSGSSGERGTPPDYMERFWAACDARVVVEKNAAAARANGSSSRSWNMQDFYQWANEALEDVALDALFQNVFGSCLPYPRAERRMILDRWQQWQKSDIRFWTLEEEFIHDNATDYLSHSFRHFFHMEQQHAQDESPTSPATRVWGGIGGFDGRGGLGHGVMYCVEKEWWNDWEDYVGWNWKANMTVQPRARSRPGPIKTDGLIDHSEAAVVGGTLGSYEVMKPGLIKDVDYVLLPPGVWDVLYELYGGGPPLPRMVLPPPRMETRTRTFSTDSKQMEEEDVVSTDASVEVVARNDKLLRIPEALSVATHPYVIHCHVCDAQQPYRRGDAGPMSIRVMATPDQPLWRLYAEIIVRLPIQNAKAIDKDGRGQARLWRNVEPAGAKDPQSRYGPWSLLCKNRSAILPVANLDLELEDSYDDLKSDWRAYTDHATVEGIGLVNGDRIMLEYAVQNKAGDFIWPREAAAKASRMRRLADEDLRFRRLLRGVDENEQPISPPPELEGMTIDAMDLTGKWFQVEILEVRTEGHDDDEEEATDGPAESGDGVDKPTGHKEIRVDFSDFGGHSEWINVETDRLATAGRFTLGKEDDDDNSEAASSNAKNGNEAKAKAALVKKTNSDVDQNATKICTLPGYGACGLANLGNTCYANSAVQCISYMPLVRSYLLSAQYKANGDLNKDNPLGTGGKLLEEFAELLRVMWIGKYGERSPTRFRAQLGKATSQFSGADQQDAQEFLNYILDILHEDSNKIKKKPYVEALEDDWVETNSLSRVGDESWRRFLRRNRSVIADVAMGQVLNTVTCPVCNFSSRNFDPFNLLSLPFPTVADVVFVCTVIRRGTAANCPRVLNRPRKGEKRKRIDSKKLRGDNVLIEQYAVAMSRLADIGDLKMRLQNICGIPANQLKLCKLEEVPVIKDADDSPVKYQQKVTALPDKDGPCVQLARSLAADDAGDKTASPTRIVAFEKTIRPRPPLSLEEIDRDVDNSRLSDEDATTADEEEDEDSLHDSRAYSPKDRRIIVAQARLYGDKSECRLYDSDPLPISKALSRTLWPLTSKEFKLGLRVDAIDHRDHWFPGSVVEILEGVATEPDEEKSETVSKVRVHFDNFSSKWDETYTIESFTRGQVRPLYSHATPRMRPTEFPVYQRFTDRSTKKMHLFGQGFYIQCSTEWSTARAGAHILAQASRFLQKPDIPAQGPVDVDELGDAAVEAAIRVYDKAQASVTEMIDILLDSDREYIKGGLGVSDDGRDVLDDSYRNPDFDPSEMSQLLVDRVAGLLHKLPFEVRLVTMEFPCGGGKKNTINEEIPFPFSLLRTIGNFINARHAIALHWRENPLDKKHKERPFMNCPVMYVAPPTAIHKSSTEVLNESKAHAASKNNPGSGGMDLSVCLTEFCKAQKLELSDCWRCPRCKDFREGKQHMDLWRLPDLLTFHIKRFNCSARWREKITTKVNFPLTGLDMSEWCHAESVCVDNNVYDLIGVMNHYGGMTGGHYVATCKATACGPDGREEVAYNFPGYGTSVASVADETDKVGWRLGAIRKEKEMMNQTKMSAAASAKYASESSEPLWLQFDDELVEPVPPRNVVSEMAYVLFYRRRHLSPANISKYSTLE